MRLSVVTVTLLLAWLPADRLFAFDAADEIFADDSMPVVLTPARLSQPLSQVPASVTIIDRELIEATGAREIYQLLQLVPGMSAVKVDGNVPTVSYHGTQARDVRRMQVLIDGRTQYLPGLARVLWNDFPLEIEDIERIEVTRGPASAAYGANAFQGVINIISRHPQDVVGTTAAARGGNNGVRDWRVTSANGQDGVSSRITVASRDDDGYGEPFKGEPRRDQKSVQTINLRTHLQVNPRDTLEFLAGGSRRTLGLPTERSDFDDFTDFTVEPENRSEEAFAQMRWKRQVSEKHQLKVQFYSQYKKTEDQLAGCFILPGLEAIPEAGGLLFSKEMRDLFEANNRDTDATEAALESALVNGPATAEEGALLVRLNALVSANAGAPCGQLSPLIVERRHDLEVENIIQLSPDTRLLVGANLRLDQGESDTYVGEPVENFSQRLFGNLEIHLAEPLYLNLGGYWEHDNLNGSYFNPRAALIYQFLPSQSLRFVYAEALRTMDIYEKSADIHIQPENLAGVYGADPLAALGWETAEFFATQTSDGGLDPERIHSMEIGYYGRVRALEWDIRIFDEQLDQLVSGPMNPEQFRPDNEGSVDIQGAEAQLSWRPHPRHLLRLAGSRISTKADHPTEPGSARIEQALAAETLSSLLWRFDVNDRWMLSGFWHRADHWSDRRFENVYERADLQVSRRVRGPRSTIEISAVVQHFLSDDPVVRVNNLYKEDDLYWLSAAVSF
ncbi:MAG: TonB-dependent receptor [Alcanivoracaceae bacterium]|nr:TonB-dependent receptor [Alcanivoracaceae bacterium]